MAVFFHHKRVVLSNCAHFAKMNQFNEQFVAFFAQGQFIFNYFFHEYSFCCRDILNKSCSLIELADYFDYSNFSSKNGKSQQKMGVRVTSTNFGNLHFESPQWESQLSWVVLKHIKNI